MADETVFAAVVDAISDVGPTALTLAKIGDRAGLTAGALVHRFGSKRGLLDAFAARGLEAVGEVFAAAARRHPRDPLAAAIDGLVRLSGALSVEPRAFANHLSWFALELADPDLRPYVVAHARSVQSALEGLLRDPVLAQHLRAVHQGALVLWAVEPAGTLASFLRRELRGAVRHRYSTPMTILGEAAGLSQRKTSKS